MQPCPHVYVDKINSIQFKKGTEATAMEHRAYGLLYELVLVAVEWS